MEEKILSGYGYCLGNKMLLLNTPASRKSTNLYNTFIDKICDIKGVTNNTAYRTENNYKILKYGLIKVEVFDCGIYYSVRFDNGQANYPKNDCSELIFF